MEEKNTPPGYKLLVIDIDGTLLNPVGEITSSTMAAVQAAQEAGIVVTLATARRYGNSKKIASELGLSGPLIVYDGALIVQHPAATILSSHLLEAEIAQAAVDILVRHRVQPVVHPDDGLREEIWTGPAELDDLLIEAYFTAYPEKMRRMPYAQLCSGHPNPRRVVAFTSEEIIQGVIPEVSVLPCSWNAISRGSYGCAELVVMAQGCSKASGVATLAKALHIPMQEVMALGDNTNDIEMLQAVGWGVAMGHAPAKVKAVAKAITTSNTEDGVAQAIERYALRTAPHASANSFNRATCL